MNKTYTTIAGDMWDGIAYKVYGDEAYTDKIMKLNPQYRHLFVFPAGVTLDLPEESMSVSISLPPWKRANL
ncbi:MAG: tail protein X [Oscillibacter ruminantium]|uniref:tail protein X n=1 Tax=Oscillibacter ruminantium TaxID=1263547 RepID=UPI002B1F606E|nr:tail protein X [Oscillibacter ruminantium]MEA5041380.1 tail protein X [Oscillibacter ruminantium]